jgi:aminoglycoside phosphotransferase (APT) family kinase protein
VTSAGKEQAEGVSIQVPGINAPRVTAWLQERLPDVRPPLDFEVVAGGRSNLTFRVTDAGGGRWVLRRPPLGNLLPSAHDVAREHRIMAALAPTAVPVPPVVGLCEDPSVNGAPFFVMEHVDGFVLRDEDDVERNIVSAEGRRTVGESLVDTLVALHDVDPDAVGLGMLGRREGYVERQLRRWRAQWDQGHTRPLPLVDEVHRCLATRIPPQGSARIVHGDFRLDNVIVSSEGELQAVLDWELCTLGDPLADVGLLLVYWSEPGEEFVALGAAPTAVPGFPDRAEVTARYRERSGRDLAECDYYMALGYWKLAIIAEGVWSRYRAGAYGEGDEGFEIFGGVVEPLLERASEAIRRTGR